MLRLYISGPVTGIPKDNRPAFHEAQKELEARGYMTNIPHNFIASGTLHEEAMVISIHKLTERNYFVEGALGRWKAAYRGVALLPGWEQSEGARLEKLVAEACGIPCKTVAEWIEEAR